jgi:hypothetical protein
MLESLRWDGFRYANLSDIYGLGALRCERVIGHMLFELGEDGPLTPEPKPFTTEGTEDTEKNQGLPLMTLILGKQVFWAGLQTCVL